MYKICFYVPETHLEEVKNALFAKGAGKVGHYSCCAWQCLGEGQFMPLQGSKAFIGETNRLEKVAEYKVEMVCAAAHIQEVITALKKAHPYEEPGYDVFRIEDFLEDLGYSTAGLLSLSMVVLTPLWAAAGAKVGRNNGCADGTMQTPPALGTLVMPASQTTPLCPKKQGRWLVKK